MIFSSASDVNPCPLIIGQSLQFLAFVDSSRIPLYLAAGPHLSVDTDSETTSEWFNGVFLRESLEIKADENGDGNNLDDGPWHGTDQIQCAIGVLAKVTPLVPIAEPADEPRVTEILLYASRVGLNAKGNLPSPPRSSPSLDVEIDAVRKEPTETSLYGEVAVYALPLSSDLIYTPSIHTHLPSLDPTEAKFLPLHTTPASVDCSKKRDRLSNLFDEASDRRKKARRRGGATSQSVVSPIVFQQRALDSHSIKREEDPNEIPSQSNQLVVTPLGSRQPTPNQLAPRRKSAVAAQKPVSNKRPPELKWSPLSQITSVDGYQESSLGARNKQAISRIVLAGMRIHGLQQRKSMARARSRSVGDTGAPRPDTPSELLPGTMLVEDEDRDVEYKGVYHQTYKGALFAIVSNPQ